MAIGALQDHLEPLSNAIASKLVENKLVETTSKNNLEEQIGKCLDKMSREDDFDIDYKIAPFRNLIPNPHIVSLYLTTFVIETVIDMKDTVDIYGSDEEIYMCINQQVTKHLPA